MSESGDPHDEAIRRLDARANALEQRTARPAAHGEGRAVDQAYRMLAELIGGVLIGLAIGFGVDRLTGVTAPWGLIGGVLLGFAASVLTARRTANRLMAQAAAEQAAAERTGTKRRTPVAAVPFGDEDEDG